MKPRMRCGNGCAIVALLAVSACQNSPTLVQLVLTPEPEINSVEELISRVDRIQIVVDSPDGLSRSDDSGSALDWDGDGDPEVVFETTLGEKNWLPVLEIGLGPHGGRELRFLVTGYPRDPGLPGTSTAALGAVSAACPRGERCKVGMPFNLVPSARSPKVILTTLLFDAAGTSPPVLVAVLSTTVREETIADNIHLLDADDQDLGTTVAVDTVVYSTSGPAEVRTVLQIELPTTLSPPPPPRPQAGGECTGGGTGVHVKVQVGPGIVGTNGLAFDQDPTSGQEDPFAATVSSGGGMCGTPGQSGGGGGTLPPCSQGFVYNRWADACVPIPACTEKCPPDYVCDPENSTCASDCRIYDACPLPGESCDADSGLCR